MFLSGTGFALIYRTFVQKKFKTLKKNEEFFTYCGLILFCSIVISTLLITNNTYPNDTAIGEAVFQSISIITTTGFATVDYTHWPFIAQVILVILYFTGACAGSASGGLKVIRLVFVYKYIKRELFKILHPNAIQPVRVNGIVIQNEIMAQMMSFVIFYFAIFAITALITIFIEENVTLGFIGSIATLGNVGAGLSAIGPMGNYDGLHSITKLIFVFNMIIGRLELIPFLAFLHPDFYYIKK
jgi:trk system potassium uptake protein TrkH